MSDELPPKCKNCTLEEVAVLRMMHENLYRRLMAELFGGDVRTVETKFNNNKKWCNHLDYTTFL